MIITKVYTRKGDTGKTSLVGGVSISKSDVRLEAYGAIDELNSHLGLLASMIAESSGQGSPLAAERDNIVNIQGNLFVVGSYLATDQSQTPLYPFAQLPEGETQKLEQAIDSLNAQLPEPQGFVLPGGTTPAAQAHVCRTVCRRAERNIAALAETATVGPEIMQYINRLSDYLFVLAKIINFNMKQSEIIWKNACR